jgi:hypothetical protein
MLDRDVSPGPWQPDRKRSPFGTEAGILDARRAAVASIFADRPEH